VIILVGTLTSLLVIAAALGVVSIVVLQTRERVRDLGVFKAVGMTPPQAVVMVVCWVAGIGPAASALRAE
jgi:putative ABC transport system permease protein